MTFDRARQAVGLVGGPLCALGVYALPIPALSPGAHTLLAIVTLVCLWWITEPVPIPVTSLIGPMLAVIFGVAAVGDAFDAFSSPVIFLFLGGFILARAMTLHGLDRRFAYKILSLKWVGSSPTRIFLAVGIATMLCSGWISNTATAAMMLPISIGLLEAIQEMMAANGKNVDLHTYKYATGLMIMTAYAASIGGVLTPIGTPPNLIMVGLLDTMADIHISFFQWMVWGFVAMSVYFAIAAAVLHFQYPADIKRIDGAEDVIRRKVEELGPWTFGQKATLVAFLGAVVLWTAPGVLSIVFGSDSQMLSSYSAMLPESVVALLAAVSLFLIPTDFENREFVMNWKEAVAGVDWGTLLLFGGGLSLGTLMFSTGLSEWVGASIVTAFGGEPSEFVFVAVFCVLSLGLSELASNTAAVNMVGPLAITAAATAGFDPIPVAVGVALSASLGFMLPVSTPPNAIVYSTGYIPITKMIKSGFIIDVVGIFCVTIPLCLLLVKFVIG
ncbi:SLC13 family permease [Slackia heliotrinireducens]|uniref:SLC13 family permease n=1 Tax=Slackia heliotrinireducens TaxID=84110 RepID=UPI003314CB6B